MQRSIFQLIVLPYLATHTPARTTWSAFSTSRRWTKTAADVEAGSSSGRAYGAWATDTDVNMAEGHLELLRLPPFRPASSASLYSHRHKRVRSTTLQEGSGSDENQASSSSEGSSSLPSEMEAFAAQLLREIGLDLPKNVEQLLPPPISRPPNLEPAPLRIPSSKTKTINARNPPLPTTDPPLMSEPSGHRTQPSLAVNPQLNQSNPDIVSAPEAPDRAAKPLRHPNTSRQSALERNSLISEAIDVPQAASLRTAIWAVYSIVQAYWATCNPRGTASRTHADITESSTSTSTVPRRDNAQSPLPPLFIHLLSRRLYRLVAFHYINTPEYASDPILLEQLASQLEVAGSGKLAARLRRGFDAPRKEDGRGRLGSATTVRDSILPPNYWDVPRLPMMAPDSTIPNRQRRMTEYHNSHLEYLLYKPASPHFQNPFGNTPPAPGLRFSRPSPNLRQLRDLLIHIGKLERTRGFVPDKRTAHLIIRCWLRCGSGWSHPSTEPSPRTYRRKDGTVVETRKQHSAAIFDAKTVRLIWQLVSRIMERELERLEVAHRSLEKDSLDENRLRYSAHVKPFCQMMKRAMLEFGDGEGFAGVIKWKREMRQRMVKLGDVESEAALELEREPAGSSASPEMAGTPGEGGDQQQNTQH